MLSERDLNLLLDLVNAHRKSVDTAGIGPSARRVYLARVTDARERGEIVNWSQVR